MFSKYISKEEAAEKIKRFCAYQPRCHKEVRDKLYSYKLSTDDVNEILSNLIAEDILNEERFAFLFTRGKLRMNHWGFVKIKYALKMKGVSDRNIKDAWLAIDKQEYEAIASDLFLKKMNSLKLVNVYEQQAKTRAYLLQKGFEPALIQTLFKNFKEQ